MLGFLCAQLLWLCVLLLQVNKKLLNRESDFFGCRPGGAKSKETRYSTVTVGV